jgi:hypothetical protein
VVVVAMEDLRHMVVYNRKALVAPNMGVVQILILNQLNSMVVLDKVLLKRHILHIVHLIIIKILQQVWVALLQHSLQTLLNLKVFGEVNNKLLVKQNFQLMVMLVLIMPHLL